MVIGSCPRAVVSLLVISCFVPCSGVVAAQLTPPTTIVQLETLTAPPSPAKGFSVLTSLNPGPNPYGCSNVDGRARISYADAPDIEVLFRTALSAYLYGNSVQLLVSDTECRDNYPKLIDIRLRASADERPVLLSALPSQSATAGVQVSINAGSYFLEPDGASLKFGATGLPAGLYVAQDTGTIEGTAYDANSYTVKVTASDPAGNTRSGSFVLTVSSGVGCGGACHGD